MRKKKLRFSLANLKSLVDLKNEERGLKRPLFSLMKILFFLNLFFSLSLFGYDAQSPYMVKNIQVEEKDTSAKAAKDKALLNAPVDAFRVLVDRMVPEEDLVKIPENLTEAQITPMIKSFSVDDEKTTPKKYSATLTYEFDGDLVKAFFDQHFVAYVENFIPDILVLPVVIDGAKNILWEEDNLWMKVWKDRENSKTRLVYKIPLGDFSDISTLSAVELIKEDHQKIGLMADKYALQDVVVCYLRLVYNQHDQTLSHIEIQPFHHSFSPSQPVKFHSFIKSVPFNEDSLKKIKQEILNLLWQTFKKSGDQTSANQEEFLCNIVTEDLKTWEDIRKKLQNVRSVKNIKILSLSKGVSQISFTFPGDMGFLNEELAKQGLVLHQESTQWYLGAQ